MWYVVHVVCGMVLIRDSTPRISYLVWRMYSRCPTSQALKWAHKCARKVPCSALFVLVGMWQ
jgi:hypothetical protein